MIITGIISIGGNVNICITSIIIITIIIVVKIIAITATSLMSPI